MLSSFAGGRLFGERSGSAPPRVLALHGWRKDHTDFAKVLQGLDAIALDLPGFGASPQPDTVWGAREYAVAIVPVLEELAQPSIVVGHSFGGKVALQLAAYYPDAVGALVLTGAPLLRRASTSRTPFAYRMAKFAHRIGVVSDERMEAERRKRGSADYRAATGLMRDILVKSVNESYETDLPLVKCHVEMVWGENDTAAPLGVAREAAAMMPDVSLTVVSGGTHWLPVEQPEAVRRAIERFLG